MSSNEVSRIFYLDQLRALAIITIIIVHVSNLWSGSTVDSFNDYVRYLFRIIGFTGVPLFFMLSGSLLLNRDYEIKDFFKRRFPRVINPFLFWMIISIILAVITKEQFHFNSLTLAVPYIVKSFTANYWFVWMIIGIYLAMPVINDFIKVRGLKGAEYFIIMFFITTILFSISKIFHYSFHYLNLALFFFAGPLGYVILGYYLRYKKLKYSANTLMIFGLTLFISSIIIKAFLTWTGWFYQPMFKYFILQSKSFLYMDILTLLQPIGIFIFFKYLYETHSGLFPKIASFLNQRIIKKLTISLSRASYGIFLVQVILIDLISLLDINLLQKNALKWIPFLVFVILIFSWSTLIILNKIPYMNKFTGYH